MTNVMLNLRKSLGGVVTVLLIGSLHSNLIGSVKLAIHGPLGLDPLLNFFWVQGRGLEEVTPQLGSDYPCPGCGAHVQTFLILE